MNIDKQAVKAKTKELASFMVERFSMNPVSCKLLNEAWEKEFPDEVAIAERMLALLDELEHYKSREERVTKLVMDNSTSWDALYKKLETAEKRTAELERANVAQDDHINQQQDRIEQLEKGQQEAAKHINSWRRLAKQNIAERGKDISELEAARQRIAELEARAVNLSKLSVGEVMHMSGFSRDYAEGWCAGNDNAIHEIRTAGIKVKE